MRESKSRKRGEVKGITFPIHRALREGRFFLRNHTGRIVTRSSNSAVNNQPHEHRV